MSKIASGTIVLMSTIVLCACSNTATNPVTVTTKDGTQVIYATQMPAQFPFAQYPGSKIILVGNSQKVASVSLTTADSIGKVAEFYRKEIKAKGWQPGTDTTMESMVALTAKSGNTDATFSISGGSHETTVAIYVTSDK